MSFAFSYNRAKVNSRLLIQQQRYTPRGIRENNTFTTGENAVWNGDFDILSNAEVSIQSANNENIKLKVTGAGIVNVEGPLVADNIYQRHPLLVPTGSYSLLVPTGSVSAYTGTSAPGGWLLCDGSDVSRSTYDVLYAIIGTTYGVGNGSTTFNLPNLKGRVVVGLDGAQTEFNTLGGTGGEKSHTLTVDEMPSHTHNYTDTYRTGNQGTDNAFSSETAADEGSTTVTKTTTSQGGGDAHNNLQPYMALNYIIKV
jgi:microcystin-dependent protein